jgi:two-component system phosphate regulon sensor histidine kinase PhoR
VLVAETAIAQVILRAEEQGMDLLFDADQTLPLVLAHPDRLAQVFANLLDNAIKYGRAGDTITVRINMHPEGASCVVQDSGPGIPAEELPRVTEQLYRVRTDVEGSGMGLALVSEILRRHHAALLIESDTAGEASGTTCRWVLRKA